LSEGTEQNASHVTVFGLSDMGRVRKNNEDAFAVCDLTTGEVSFTPALRDLTPGPSGLLFMVADGMGGQASGEVASQICTETVPGRLHESLKSAGPLSEAKFALLLRESIEYANQMIHQKAQSDPAFYGMGTTATVAGLFRHSLFVAQVGTPELTWFVAAK